DVDGKVEEVTHGKANTSIGTDPRGLEDVESLDQHDVRVLDHKPLAWEDVVLQVGVDGSLDPLSSRLDVDHEPQQGSAVVRLREPLAIQQSATLELGIGVEEAVGRDERHVRMFGPVREQLTQQTRGGGLAHGDGAGDADDERRATGL